MPIGTTIPFFMSPSEFVKTLMMFGAVMGRSAVYRKYVVPQPEVFTQLLLYSDWQTLETPVVLPMIYKVLTIPFAVMLDEPKQAEQNGILLHSAALTHAGHRAG